MYGWLWRSLPGPLTVRVLTLVALTGTTAALLWFVVFPWIEPRLPLDPTLPDR
ncbi:hypothetical protein ACFQ08_09840 [Streptosporangium algeriense]|uniref:Uncharacterized protein n=1 Tax=Streptosporangium algeriense TaxID=1682748 RepID=A0ABW3DNW5_9ACTN